MAAPEQLSLPFAHRPAFAIDFIEAPSNAAALGWLARTQSWPDGRLALWGAAGCGKTHLLHLWAAASGAQVVAGPALTEPRRTTGLAIDEADAVADETVLLHTLNVAAEAGRPVLIAARLPPARWTTQLLDLASRLRAVTAVPIGPAEDSLLQALLARLLAERQIAVPPATRDWLLLHLPRAPGAVREAVGRLDRGSLGAGRRVTPALARDVLGDLLA